MWSAAKPMMTTLLQGLQSRSGAAASVAQRVLDDADAIVELSTPLFTAVVFPTADTLPEVRSTRPPASGVVWRCRGRETVGATALRYVACARISEQLATDR